MKQSATLPFNAAPASAGSPPRPPDVPPRDRSGSARETLPLPAPATPTAFAVATWDARAQRMIFLSRGASSGNLMSTPDPLWAKTWQSPGALRLWASELGPEAQAQLASRPRLIVPVTASAGEAVGTLEIEVAAVPASDSAA